jgi:hypothetical protein
MGHQSARKESEYLGRRSLQVLPLTGRSRGSPSPGDTGTDEVDLYKVWSRQHTVSLG